MFVLLFIIRLELLQLLVVLFMDFDFIFEVTLKSLNISFLAIKLTLLMPNLNLEILILLSKSIWLIFLFQVLSSQLFILFFFLLFMLFKITNLGLECLDFAFLIFDSILIGCNLVLHVLDEFLIAINFRHEACNLISLPISDSFLQILLLVIQLLGLRPQFSYAIIRIVNLFLDLLNLVL